ncbi:MAG: DUF4402 domain-containing protein [Bdellovibrio sp.]
MRLFAKKFMLLIAATLLVFAFPYSEAETTAGRILMIVVHSLSITEVKPMKFASATQGAAEATILPGDENSAVFNIQGEPNMSFQIQLPIHAALSINGDASPDKSIQIYNFSSTPSNTGHLNSNGDQILSVGATRQTLSSTQSFGTYSGSFQVTIIY